MQCNRANEKATERERERSERKRKGILEPVAFTFTDHKDYTYYPFYMIA